MMEDERLRIGIVVIGRNEGERLVRCLASVGDSAFPMVYVDSGSEDSSVQVARDSGAAVVELDMDIPFTAARARNAGGTALLERYHDVQLIQFVDGDCEICPGWFEAARGFFGDHPQVAVLSGLLRERDPSSSIYNRLAGLEWQNMPVGEGALSGGNLIVRRTAFETVGGFNAALIAGEDPDFCCRIEDAGLGVYRLEQDMALHDTGMFEFSQWWKRQVRSGHSYLELYALLGKRTHSSSLREVASILVLGGVIPLMVVLLAGFASGASALILLVYPVFMLRIGIRKWRGGTSIGDSMLYASACVAGKIPAAQGVVTSLVNRWVLRRASTLIDYKEPQ